MKTLLLMRHAKSSWEQPAARDFDRPLNARGLRSAPVMGRYLQSQGLKPDLILSSPAQRAQHTAQLVQEAARFAAPLRYEAGIYEATLDELLAIVWGLEDAWQTVLLVGHNPGLSVLSAYLTNVSEQLSTAAVSHIKLDIASWQAARAGNGQLAWLVKPKQLENTD